VPGEFKSFGHDYRGDVARFVQTAYRFSPVTDEQLAKVEDTLKQLELERGERIKQTKEQVPETQTGAPKRTRGPKYLRDRKLTDPKTEPMQATPGEAAGDYQ